MRNTKKRIRIFQLTTKQLIKIKKKKTYQNKGKMNEAVMRKQFAINASKLLNE